MKRVHGIGADAGQLQVTQVCDVLTEYIPCQRFVFGDQTFYPMNLFNFLKDKVSGRWHNIPGHLFSPGYTCRDITNLVFFPHSLIRSHWSKVLPGHWREWALCCSPL